jgi:heptosyltransferase II
MPKILIVAPSWIGDCIIAQALFKALKQQSYTIDVLAPSWTQDVFEFMPQVDRTIPNLLNHGQLQLLRRWQLGLELRQQRYHRAVVLPNSWKSALIPWVAKIPRRTGWLGELRYGLLNDYRRLNKKSLPLLVQRFLALGADPSEPMLEWRNCRPEFQVDPVRQANTFKKFDLMWDHPVLALCPGAEFGSSKRWPARYFASVAQQKLHQGWRVCLFGSTHDASCAHVIQRETNNQCIDLIGKTTLREAIELLAGVQIVVTNDSGLMHVASALNKPVIALYGSTSAQFTPPLTDLRNILTLNLDCSPCWKRECPLGHHHCLELLQPEQVLEAMNRFEIA